jgi:hypothetical protein
MRHHCIAVLFQISSGKQSPFLLYSDILKAVSAMISGIRSSMNRPRNQHIALQRSSIFRQLSFQYNILKLNERRLLARENFAENFVFVRDEIQHALLTITLAIFELTGMLSISPK